MAGGDGGDRTTASTPRVATLPPSEGAGALGAGASLGGYRVVAYVGGGGMVHRDFKPDNVMVDADGRARVSDFGLAWAPRADDDAAVPLGLQDTQVGAMSGTPAYMAPEQHLGQPVDARADQFAFCASL